jgi:hypothetical protein
MLLACSWRMSSDMAIAEACSSQQKGSGALCVRLALTRGLAPRSALARLRVAPPSLLPGDRLLCRSCLQQ